MTQKWRQDSTFLALIEDLLALEEVQSLANFRHHYYTNRLAHSLSVSYRSYCWAKRFKLDCRAIARAGLLHDLFFYYPQDYPQLVGGIGHLKNHPRIALENALKLVELNDLEQDIILKHMFGCTWTLPKYPESYIVTLMDKQCAIYEVVGASIGQGLLSIKRLILKQDKTLA
ncbi:HD domain-containing protein [Vaginisenegalia massiliensis]|uniref:HD domain-containing protein n=1 Tax=Vaginisenegalia massiliensis TaxID=2058294 RepID=UPI000F521316|nr:HD domain-containing protein [Vaginisenegalia massiliensis]